MVPRRKPGRRPARYTSTQSQLVTSARRRCKTTTAASAAHAGTPKSPMCPITFTDRSNSAALLPRLPQRRQKMTDITFECRGVSFALTTDHSQSSYGNAVLVRKSDGAVFGALDEIELPSML